MEQRLDFCERLDIIGEKATFRVQEIRVVCRLLKRARKEIASIMATACLATVISPKE